MPFIFIDRRKAGKGKSSSNRQKLIKRIKSFIKTSIPQNIGQGGVSGTHAKNSTPVKVASKALEEPWFCYANDGDNVAVIIGNDQYDRGDEIDIPGEDDEDGNGAGQGDAGTDDFIVNIARDEFLDLFFEDCELPNLYNERTNDNLDCSQHPAGFSTSGNPSQLSIIRTYKQMVGRRKALKGPYQEEKAALELELAAINLALESNPLNAKANKRSKEIILRLEEIENKFIFLDGFDRSDLRFRKKEFKPLKTVEAVLVMIMDISGSMDEKKKTIARRWFALMYAFIKRKYADTELVFIAHHDEAFEMNEGDFFSTRINGGTSVSPALRLANTIIKERYDPAHTNIYVCHASDGDNWEQDNKLVINELVGEGNLCKKIQMFSYVEVGKSSYGYNRSGSGKPNTNLWQAYDSSRVRLPKRLFTMSIIEEPDDCYPIFKKVFKKIK